MLLDNVSKNHKMVVVNGHPKPSLPHHAVILPARALRKVYLIRDTHTKARGGCTQQLVLIYLLSRPILPFTASKSDTKGETDTVRQEECKEQLLLIYLLSTPILLFTASNSALRQLRQQKGVTDTEGGGTLGSDVTLSSQWSFLISDFGLYSLVSVQPPDDGTNQFLVKF